MPDTLNHLASRQVRAVNHPPQKSPIWGSDFQFDLFILPALKNQNSDTYMKKMLIWIILLTCAVASAGDGGYLFVTFKGEQNPMTEQIYFALSQDGRQWTALNHADPVLASKVGERGVRDPYLVRSADGKKFFILATDLSIHYNGNWGRAVHEGSKSLVIWESTNLVNWSEPRLVKVAPDDAGCTWAPEAVYDTNKQAYLTFWASTTGRDNFSKHRIWAAWTKDFVTFEKPFIYIEKPWTVIDTDIVQTKGKFYRFSKDEENKTITMEVSEHLLGPWQNVPSFSLAKDRGYEGPECYQLKSSADNKPGAWCLILDQYSRGTGYQPFVTDDLTQGNFKPGADFKFPFKFRHGAILTLSDAEYQRLQTAYNHL